MRVARASALTAGVLVVHQSAAWADTTKDEAQALFESARAMMIEGNFREACPRLERSEALDPGIGTQFNLARCYELEGRLASASRAYTQVVAATQAAGQSDREALARSLAAALEPRVAHIRLDIGIDQRPPGFELRLDGAPLEHAVWDTPIPVDAGKHIVVASAALSSSWQTEIAITDGQNAAVHVPPLAPALAAFTVPATSAPLGEAARDPRPQRTIAVILAALGLGGIGVGTYYGFHSMSLASEADPLCDARGCSPTGFSLRSDAHAAGAASTISFIMGGVLLAASAVLWFSAPSHAMGSRQSPNH